MHRKRGTYAQRAIINWELNVVVRLKRDTELIKSPAAQNAGEGNAAIYAEINLPHRRVPFIAMKPVSRKE
jgi:hypothetical protein